jgi:hypothetical protein
MHYMDTGMYDLYLCPEGWTCGGKTVDPRIPLPAMCQNGWWDLLYPEYVQPKVIVEDIHYIYGIFIRDHFSRDVIRGSPQMVGPVFVDKTQKYLSHFQNLEDAEACACTWCLSTQAVDDIRELHVPIIGDAIVVLHCASEEHGDMCHRAFANFWVRTDDAFEYSTQGFLSTARRGIVVRANQLQTFTGLFKILYSDSHWVFQGHVVSPMQQIHGRYTGEQDCLAVLVDHATRNDILRKVDPELQTT